MGPEEQNLVDDYLPEYMRCLIKSNKRAVDGREGRSMQFICSLLPANIRSFVCPSGGNDSDDDSEGSDADSEGSDSDSDASDDDSDASDDDSDASDDDSDASDDDSDASEDESDGSEE